MLANLVTYFTEKVRKNASIIQLCSFIVQVSSSALVLLDQACLVGSTRDHVGCPLLAVARKVGTLGPLERLGFLLYALGCCLCPVSAHFNRSCGRVTGAEVGLLEAAEGDEHYGHVVEGAAQERVLEDVVDANA